MKFILETENLILRPSEFSDCCLFYRWESQDYIKKFFTMNDWRDEEEITKEFILREQDYTKAQFTIITKEDHIPIGRIYLSKFDRHADSIDITRIYIGEEAFIRKGYGRESLKALLSCFFNQLKLERVTIDFFTDNTRAENLYTSLGFKSEGILRHVDKKNNNYIDLHLMSMLRQEYFSTL